MDYTSKSHAAEAAASAADEVARIDQDLIDRRDALMASEPRLRGRALADRLGMSEAQILMIDRGRSVHLLRPEWPGIIGEVRGLGTVMAFTRNDHVIHEKIGRYAEVMVNRSGQAVVVGEEINLRLFFDRWRFGFAVREGILNSLQFFDRFGNAIHKVYLLDDSDRRAFDKLVDAFEGPDDFSLRVERLPIVHGELPPDFAIDIEKFWSDWDSQRDPHEFTGLLESYGLRHIHAFRLAGDERARQLPARMFGRALEMAAAREVPIVVQIESRGAVQMHAGTVINVSRRGSWLNVLDPAFNLHLFEDALSETWAVTRPTPKGLVLSLEAVDIAGNSVATISGTIPHEYGGDEPWSGIVKSL